MNLRLTVLAAMLTALAACAASPQYVDIAVFTRRPPPPGQPGYLETIRYIDDGMRYVDPGNAFFIAPDGRMCFRGGYTLSHTIFDVLYKTDWCLYPAAVREVELMPDIVTGTYRLQLSCKHAAGQCVAEAGSLYRQAAVVTLPIVPPRQEKTAVEHLVWLMGGALGEPQPFR